jgi:hypothetical protein
MTQSPVTNTHPPSGTTSNVPNVHQRNNQGRPLASYCDTKQNQNSSPESTETSSEETLSSPNPNVDKASSRVATYHPTQDSEEEIALTNMNHLRYMWGAHAYKELKNTYCGEDEEYYDTSQGSYHEEELSDE